MPTLLSRAFLKITARKREARTTHPLLCELLQLESGQRLQEYRIYPFVYRIVSRIETPVYSVSLDLPRPLVARLREAVSFASDNLEPERVDPLAFEKLVEILSQLSARVLAGYFEGGALKSASTLAACECMGMSRLLALALDGCVNEFYVDSETTPIYLDHAKVGRCETGINLTERERNAIVTHMDTFRGYTVDFASPSLKNDLEIGGARLRISVDTEPLAVNRFSLDVRRLNVVSMSLPELVRMKTISTEAAAFLVAWLELGGNVTIVGETGTGKTTLLNALDESLPPRLRRVYIEDAVETLDLLSRGYHQLKVKVDPFERESQHTRTKDTEIVKVLHRSPDLVILSEIQSEEHSRAFFHSLSSGARGIQTFHSSAVEQAIRRWGNIHRIPKESLLELGVLVQMSRPDRLQAERIVSRICQVVDENGEPRVREIYLRDRSGELQRVSSWDRVRPPEGKRQEQLESRVQSRMAGLE